MAKSLRWNFIIVFLLSLIIDHSSSSSTIELNIELAEELPVGTEVANLAADAGIDGGRDELQFDVISGSFYEHFIVGGDTTRGHLLIVDRILDREVICSHRSASIITPF